MAITDNKFTADEFGEALKGEHGKDILRIVQNKIMEQPDWKQPFEQAFAAPLTKQHAERIEADVLELTKVEKKADEKYYDYLKRAFVEYTKPMQDELTILKGKHTPNEVDQKRIEQLEAKLKEVTEKSTEDLTKKDAEVFQAKAKSELQTALLKLQGTYKPGQEKQLVDFSEKAVMKELLETAKIQGDGTITFIDDKGEVIMDEAYKPITAEGIMQKKLGFLVDPGRKQEGAGSQPNPPTPDGGQQQQSKYTTRPADVTTKDGLTKHLLSLGIVHGSDEFDTIFEKDGANLPIR